MQWSTICKRILLLYCLRSLSHFPELCWTLGRPITCLGGGFLCILHVGHDRETSFTSFISSLLKDHKGPALVMGWSNLIGWASCFSDLLSVTVKVTCDVAEECCFVMICFAFDIVATACCYEWNFLSKGIGDIILKIESLFGLLQWWFWRKEWYIVFNYICLDCDVVVTK